MSTKELLTLSLGSIGVVYGDIGTSPLYAFREALRPVASDGIADFEVIGLVSLMLWTLTVIVTIKYVSFLLRADNNGEGGTLALLALLSKQVGEKRRDFLLALGLVGAALFLGDAMITPALSILSAVEGLKLVAPDLSQFVIPISVAILVALFVVQARGTGAVAKAFGPITLVWFIVMALGGVIHISDDLSIFAAINPWHAVWFVFHGGWAGFVVLGAVFLTVTGAEALYADLGHFGRRSIQWAWFVVVFPALTLNYLGQGAFILKNPAAASDPFFLMFPKLAVLPVVILATAATIIASQAVITGAFSMTQQAMHLGFLPRMQVDITSAANTGQIYLPGINKVLLFGVMLLVLIFQTSESLATAYGISVTGAMVVTTIMFFDFLRFHKRWSTTASLLVVLPLVALELVFLSSNLLKIHDGGYVPILIAGLTVVVMWTWRRGAAILVAKAKRDHIPLQGFIASISRKGAHAVNRVPGTAVFLTSRPDATPPALLHNLKHNHALHEANVILTVRTEDVPTVPPDERGHFEALSDGFSIVTLRFGFMEEPNINQALGGLRKEGFKFDIMTTSFYLGRRKIISDPNSGMPGWQDRLFITMASAAADPSDYFELPANRVVEMGAQVSV
ncbi:potassium transporter Kup [Rhizobium sp. KVB221]|uniref:Probable potassium transport system protein Kup n=1 Tax=Rhizobium setariae TaxID=2801340 RepID=A0A936YUB4_9HYPH|nr:potassium transporter Kup [Rhizobium setariae]MBL0375152.1 potassium transporter Kup [Rhizobium setariae]